MTSTLRHSGEGKTMETMKRLVIVSSCWEEMEEEINTLVVDTCYYTFLKTRNIYKTKEIIIMCLWALVNNKVSILFHQL